MPQEIEIPSDELHETPTAESTLPPVNDNSLPVTTQASVEDVPQPSPVESASTPNIINLVSAVDPETAPIYPNRIAASELTPHPRNAEIIRAATPDEDSELDESIRTDGVQRPLKVTDHTCASGPRIVLWGCRRRHFAARNKLDVPVVWVSGLSESDEENLIVQDNSLDQLARRLTEADLAKAENYIWLREMRGAGFRSDLAANDGSTSVHMDRGCSVRQIVAAAVKRPASQVRNRHAIYYDPVSPTILRDAVSTKRISLSKGYSLVVEARDAFNVPKQSASAAPGADGIESPDLPELVSAREDITSKVEKLLGQKPVKKKPKPPVAPKILNSATLSLSDGQQRVQLGRHSVLVVPNGDTIELRETVSGVEPVLGGPQEDRPLTFASSVEAIKDLLDELPDEFKERMVLDERAVTDPRIFFEAEIAFPGYPDLCPGNVRITGWRRQGDWWEDDSTSRYPRTALDNPVIHIEGEVSQKEERVYFAGSHPYSTIRALKSFLLKVILYELGPSYGVTCTGDTWLDRHGVELVLPRNRAGGPWDPTTPQSIPCPVRVVAFEDIEQLPEHALSPNDLDMFGWFIDFDALTAGGQSPRFFDVPHCQPDHSCEQPCKYPFGYPFLEGHSIVQALHGLTVNDAAIIARAAGFEVHAPDFFDVSPHQLANSWFLVSYALRKDSGTHIIMVDAGWTDESGSPKGVLTRILDGDGHRKACAALHPISAVGRPNELFPVHILIDKRGIGERANCGIVGCAETESDSITLEASQEEETAETASTLTRGNIHGQQQRHTEF